MSLEASMSHQDWAQISFRSETLSHWFNNEAGRWSAKRKNFKSADLRIINRVSQNGFGLQSSSFCIIRL